MGNNLSGYKSFNKEIIEPYLVIPPNVKNKFYQEKKICLISVDWKYFIETIGLLSTFETLEIKTDFQWYIGVSVGALICLLQALNCSFRRFLIEVITQHLPLQVSKFDAYSFFSLLFHGSLGQTPPIVKIIYDLATEKTIKRTNLTFRQLYEITGKKLVIPLTNLSNYDIIYTSTFTTPDLSLLEVIEASCSTPFLHFPKKILIPGSKEENVFIDGSVIDSFPVDIFDVNCNRQSIINDLPPEEKNRISFQENNYFCIRTYDIALSNNPYYDSFGGDYYPRLNIPFFSHLLKVSSFISLGRESIRGRKWKAQTIVLFDPFVSNRSETVGYRSAIDAYNKGIGEAIQSLSNYIISKGQSIELDYVPIGDSLILPNSYI